MKTKIKPVEQEQEKTSPNVGNSTRRFRFKKLRAKDFGQVPETHPASDPTIGLPPAEKSGDGPIVKTMVFIHDKGMIVSPSLLLWARAYCEDDHDSGAMICRNYARSTSNNHISIAEKDIDSSIWKLLSDNCGKTGGTDQVTMWN